MNPLASIAKSLRELETAYGKIKSEETRVKAQSAIQKSLGEMCPVQAVSQWSTIAGESTAPTATFSGGGSVTIGENWNAPESFSASSVGTTGLMQTWVNGVTTVYPKKEEVFVDEGEPGPGSCLPREIEGDVGGTGTFYPETVTEEIGGWPMKAIIQIVGLAPNRRLLKARLGDERMVSVERGMRPWRPGEKVISKLVRAGSSPLYRIMPGHCPQNV